MTNAEILLQECALRGITEEVHTFTKWKSLGYSVRKGEKALFYTSLWKQTKKRKEVEDDNANEEDKRLYLYKSYLFGRSQVEKMEEK